MPRRIEITSELWIVVHDVAPEYDDGLFYISDSSGGDVIVGKDEIHALAKEFET